MKELIARLLKDERFIIGASYVIFMLVFYFIAMPKQTFINHFIAAMILTGVFYALVKLVKAMLGK